MVAQETASKPHYKHEAKKRSKKATWLSRVFFRCHYLFTQLFFSSLTKRIVILNVAALCVLVTGIMYLNQFRDGLIDTKIEALRTQSKIIAGAIAASTTFENRAVMIDPEKLMELQAGQSLNLQGEATENWNFPINPELVAPLLRRIISPETTRATIYDRDTNLLFDSRMLYSNGQVLSYNLSPITEEKNNIFQQFFNWVVSIIYGETPASKKDQMGGTNWIYPEILSALKGQSATSQRRNERGELVVSVAVPIQRSHDIVGVLLLSTIGADIDNIVSAERLAIFKIFAIVTAVLVILSIFMAYTIANPLRKLSAAADRVRHGNNKRVAIPNFSYRQDEVGHLSTSIRDMTNALYARIEAIERFAADVSHELKNPLTSLRSAVETLPLAKNDESRKRLFDVIQHDVRRLDRLITDISGASRLDAELARENTEKVDMAILLENIVRAAREVRRNKTTAKIKLDIAPREDDKPYIIIGHDLRLGQVISNLIENARSFIPAEGGEILIHMSAKANKLKIIVEDNGPGISAEKIDRIFERFYTDRPGVESFGQNSGLGLSISRQIIEAHNGTLKAENIYEDDNKAVKRGARFIICLHLEK